ncbi:MAG: thioredoxin [Halanaerobiales bacterium]|nr:thioredoxin [Halanaerobiales bacterium]
MSKKPIEVNDGNFRREVLKSDVPVLVDFWADWCAPCKMVAPVVEKIAREYSDDIKVTKLDVDKNQSTASRYNVMSIPTLLIFEDGREKDRIVGYAPKNKLVAKLGLK